MWLIQIPVFFCFFLGQRDAVGFRGPLAQIDEFASFRTKRAEWIRRAEGREVAANRAGYVRSGFCGGIHLFSSASCMAGCRSEVILQIAERQVEFDIGFATPWFLGAIQGSEANIDGIFVGADFGEARQVSRYRNTQHLCNPAAQHLLE